MTLFWMWVQPHPSCADCSFLGKRRAWLHGERCSNPAMVAAGGEMRGHGPEETGWIHDRGREGFAEARFKFGKKWQAILAIRPALRKKMGFNPPLIP